MKFLVECMSKDNRSDQLTISKYIGTAYLHSGNQMTTVAAESLFIFEGFTWCAIWITIVERVCETMHLGMLDIAVWKAILLSGVSGVITILETKRRQTSMLSLDRLGPRTGMTAGAD